MMDEEKKKRYLNNRAIIGAPTGHRVKALAEFAATHTNKIEVVTVGGGLRKNFYAVLTQGDIDKLGNAINKGLREAGLLPAYKTIKGD